jgi:hypothetical protein
MGQGNAEPTGEPVSILYIRPYQGGALGAEFKGAVYIRVDSASLCNTDTFRIELKYEGAKEIYAAALAAQLAGKKVRIEIKPVACTWGHEIQSLYVE